jgi:hypothetical protein
MPMDGFSIIIGIIIVIVLWEYYGHFIKQLLGPSLSKIREGFAHTCRACPSLSKISEGFTGAMSIGSSKFLASYIPRRGDVGPEQEEDTYIMDPRYFHDYTDVQGFNGQTDYCRMVIPKGTKDETQKFFACALGGTDGLSSVSYRTQTIAEGFKLSRDDYMRDIQGRGINSYCRILKAPDGQFKALCNVGGPVRFRDEKMIPDNTPPEHIATLLRMYSGVVAWLRLADDMVDYAGNLYVSEVGEIEMDETVVNPEPVRGLQFDGISAYLRIGDNPQLEFGNTIMPRNIRTMMCWVKFDEFTNNAHIFDFGDGAGINNVFLGIIGRGNNTLENTPIMEKGCDVGSTVPDGPSGASLVEEMTPRDFLENDPTVCTGFTVKPRKLGPVLPTKPIELESQTAHLCYEIWDRDDRKMRVEVPNAFMKGVWTHVVIAALTDDPYRPDIAFYINGKLRLTHANGWLPQRNETSKNYIGRSNWIDASGPYANKSELFKGSLWDFRMYNTVMAPKLIQESYNWGARKLKL